MNYLSKKNIAKEKNFWLKRISILIIGAVESKMGCWQQDLSKDWQAEARQHNVKDILW